MALDDFIFFAEVIDSDNDNDSENEYNNDYESSGSDSSTDSYSTSSYRSYRPTRSNDSVESNTPPPPKPSPKRQSSPSHYGCLWAILAFVIIAFIGKTCEDFTHKRSDYPNDYVESESEYSKSVPLPDSFPDYEPSDSKSTNTISSSTYQSSYSSSSYDYDDEDDYDEDGYDEEGYDEEGYDEDGYDEDGNYDGDW